MSEVKVNKISPRSGTDVTLGDSGDTFTIPSGATINNQGTAVNFGATGSASWVTTVKTSTFTAVAGEGYFINTTGGVVSVNLPAGTAGAVVAVKDYANTFDTNAVTLVQNGSDKIGGSTVNATLSIEGLAVTLVFIDSTQGWLVTDNGTQDTAPTTQYVTATGGTITTSGNFKIHTFTGPGAFCVSNAGNAAGSNTVDYLVVAGGGGGGWDRAGGGGAGGFRESPGTASGSYTVSPLGASPAVALSVPVASYPIAVGGGGTNGNDVIGRGVNGSNSSFSSITSAGGGGGGAAPCSQAPGLNGGSGGGTSGPSSSAGSGNTPPVSPSQGFPGGIAPAPGGGDHGGGGGGATAAGTPGAGSINPGTASGGGAGATTSISASPTAYAGGGGGGFSNGGSGCSPFPGGAGGTGGGGTGGTYPSGLGTAGTTNTGGGGGGGSNGTTTSPASNGGAGGSGIVVIRYKFQN